MLFIEQNSANSTFIGAWSSSVKEDQNPEDADCDPDERPDEETEESDTSGK